MQRKEKDNRPLRRLVVYSLKGDFFSFFLFVQDIHTLILLNNHNIVENIEREKWNDFYY